MKKKRIEVEEESHSPLLPSRAPNLYRLATSADRFPTGNYFLRRRRRRRQLPIKKLKLPFCLRSLSLAPDFFLSSLTVDTLFFFVNYINDILNKKKSFN